MSSRIDAAALLNFSRGIELVVSRETEVRSLPRVTQSMISVSPGRARIDALLRKPSHEERLMGLLRPSLPSNLLDAHATEQSLIALTQRLRQAAAAGGEHAPIFRRAAAIVSEESKSRELVGAYKRALVSA
ncbi:hypothetical protein FP568_04335 [Pandoraea pnomenusa]|uniref:type III secretion apparatus assembly protein SctX n=1 Tax=Pandoraea pnomenusa TaxID=93220 RepID=UPI001198AF90|nr:hypothetical protein [Pandoraea pnomenusa]QDX20557.1 hypothetical protein FP568_04335 [Pandoraea pnomenusa]